MIGYTIIEDQLKKAIILSDSIAWFESHTPDLKDYLLDLIRDRQLMQFGIDSNNDIIGFYSYFTELISGGVKKQGDPYNLKDTGYFYKSMFISVLKDSILIDADYQKMKDQNWWSIDILGLTDKHLDFYAQRIKENYIKYARKILQID